MMVIERSEGNPDKIHCIALLTYVMSIFLLSLDIFKKKIVIAIARFWWSSNPSKRGCIGRNGRNFVIKKRKVVLVSV